MAKDDEGLVVEIDQSQLTLDPDTEVKAKTKEDTEKKDDEPKRDSGTDEAIESLKRQLETLEAARIRDRAEIERKSQEAAELRQHANGAVAHAAQRDYDLVNTNIANAKSRAEVIKRELRQARVNGDTDLEAELMVESARIGASLDREENRKTEIETRHRREQAQREAEAKKPQAPSDPFEAAIADLSPKSKAWLRAHPDCVTDDVMNAKIMLADREAKRKGFAADTTEYFDHIEKSLGFRKDIETDDTDDEPAPRRSEKQSYAAPVSRDTTPGAPPNPRQRRLSREQVEVAESLGMTPAQYATWLTKAEKDGKYLNH